MPRSKTMGTPGTRSDAKRNYARLLEAAQTAVADHGASASLRDIARQAGVGLGTLYRHFPTRDALLEALLSDRLDAFATVAFEAAKSERPADALSDCLGQYLSGVTVYRGVAASMLATFRDPASALHASCAQAHRALDQLLKRAQMSGSVRADLDATDLFALLNAIAWLAEQNPTLRTRRRRLMSVMLDGLRVGEPGRPRERA